MSEVSGKIERAEPDLLRDQCAPGMARAARLDLAAVDDVDPVARCDRADGGRVGAAGDVCLDDAAFGFDDRDDAGLRQGYACRR